MDTSPYLSRPDDTKEFYTNERCHILECFNNHDTSKAFSIARARVEPGVTTAWHRLEKITEVYYILAGAGRMDLGEDTSFEVHPGDIVTIPEGMPQRITNTIDEDLLFLAICNPPFTDDNYEDLDVH